MRMKSDRPVWIIACAALLAVAVFTGASPARATGDTFAKATELLTGLLVVTLFLERSLAVINDVWLGEEREAAEIKVRHAKDELDFVRKGLEREKVTRDALMLEVARSGDLDSLNQESSAIKLLNGEIKTRETGDRLFAERLGAATVALSGVETRRADLRLRAGFVFALIISAVGVRTLAPLFTLGSVGTEQSYAFRATDILLTAGLIAGGSTGINAIAELLGKYIDASRKKVG
jgi:hypothetical protein